MAIPFGRCLPRPSSRCALRLFAGLTSPGSALLLGVPIVWVFSNSGWFLGRHLLLRFWLKAVAGATSVVPGWWEGLSFDGGHWFHCQGFTTKVPPFATRERPAVPWIRARWQPKLADAVKARSTPLLFRPGARVRSASWDLRCLFIRLRPLQDPCLGCTGAGIGPPPHRRSPPARFSGFVIASGVLCLVGVVVMHLQ